MKKLLSTFSFLLLAQPAVGEFVTGPAALVGEVEDVAIDPQILGEVSFEEPQFAKAPKEREWQRGPASANKDFWTNLDTTTDWTGGELQVLKEIPYTPAQLSRVAVEAEVLAELKKQ